MPDATGGVASGLYWVMTGKMPAEDLEDEDLKSKPEGLTWGESAQPEIYAKNQAWAKKMGYSK